MGRAPNSGKKSKKTAKPGKPKTSSHEVDEQREVERRKRARSRDRRRKLKFSAIILVPVLVLTVLMGRGAYHYLEQRSAIDDMTSGSCEFDRKTDPGASGQHVENPTFAVNPPAGGLHTVAVASEGDYSSTAAANMPPDGQLVHALEHGLIDIWYQPGTSSEDLERLRQIRTAHENDVLLIPRASLPVPFAATAWHERLLCQQLETESIERFVEFYKNKGPEKVDR